MPNSAYVFDTNADNFPRLVLENSAKGPVLVNYWSPKAGPCMMLMPRLVRLAGEFGGRFLLVMLNTDELGQLARSHGVVSLPTAGTARWWTRCTARSRKTLCATLSASNLPVLPTACY